MKRFAIRLQLLAAVTAALLLGAQQPPPAEPDANATPQPAKGEIAGTVVSAKTGEILKSVAILLVGLPRGQRPQPGAQVRRNLVTGGDGKFAFLELPTGEYYLICSKAGYSGMRRTQASVSLGQNESRKDVTVRLKPTAVVTGRVLDAYGEPLPDARVMAMARQRALRGTRWRTVQSATTNDLGEYRLYDLEAGKYVLMAKSPHAPSPEGVLYAEFAPSYYPGAPSPESAAPVRLASGDELMGVDFQLGPGYETTLQGLVMDSDTGKPCGNPCRVGLQDPEFGDAEDVSPTKEGVFLFQGAPPGPHRVVVMLESSDSQRTASEQVQIPESRPVEVKLILGVGQKVSGEVVLEKPPEEKPAANAATAAGENSEEETDSPFFIQLEPKEGDMWGGRGPAPAQGGPFELANVSPGDYWIRAWAPGGSGYLKAVTLDGTPFESPSITVTSDGPISGLKLTMAFDGASITGVVKSGAKDEDLGNTSELAAFLVPEEESNAYAVRRVERVRPDATIQMQGLTPGTYSLMVLPVNGADFDSAEIRRVLEPYTKKITLSKGEKAQVELTRVPDTIELW